MKHPRYKYLSDVEKYLARYRRPKPSVNADEVFDYYETDG
jgi:hypothetical protein